MLALEYSYRVKTQLRGVVDNITDDEEMGT